MKIAKTQEAIGRASAGPVSVPSRMRRIRSKDLFADATQVLIEHQDSSYRLQITSQGKLLLTK